MKFVDEFRDSDLIAKTRDEIRRLADPGRHYRLMEVCGGHTHAIYRFGLKDVLPDNIELIHGPGCPVCVLPMGRIDDGLALARRPEVIFAAFGDMMRVPGAHGSPLEHKARGLDVRIVYSPTDALKLARTNPDRHVMFFAIGFETTAPSTALTLMRAKAEGIENFSVFCNHVTIIPAIRAILDSPDMRLDGFIGPGHVSTVIGCRPYEWIAKDEGKPIVVSGFEPLDMLQAIVMLLRQMKEGRTEVENQYKRVVPWEGNRAALGAMAEVFDLRPYFEWRGLGFISQSALRLRDAYAAVGRGAGVQRRRRAGDRPQGRPVRRGPQGSAQARPVQAVRQGVHAGAPGRCTDGLLGRLMRSLLQLRASEDRGLAPDPDAGLTPGPANGASAPIRFRDSQIEMAHGAGGKASPAAGGRPVRAAALRVSGPGEGDRLSDAARVLVGGAPVVITTDGFVVTPLVFPGGSIGELAVNGTVNDLAVSGARPVALVTTFVLEAGLPTEILAGEVRAMARAARAAGIAIVGGDTKVVEHGKVDRLLHHDDRHRAAAPGVSLGAGSVRPGDKVLLLRPDRRPRDHDPARARGARPRGRPPLRHPLGVPAGRGPGRSGGAGHPLDAGSTRGGVATRSTSWRSTADSRCIFPRNDPGARRGARRLRAARPRPAAYRQRGPVPRRRCRGPGRPGARGAARRRGGEEAVIIGEIRDEPSGAVLVGTRTAGPGSSTCSWATRCQDLLSRAE